MSTPPSLALAHSNPIAPAHRRRDADRRFAEVVLPHQTALYAAAVRLCSGDRAEAQDLVQDVLERALRHFESLSSPANPRGWLFTILHHLFIDRCRAKKREAVPVEEIDVAAPEEEVVETPAWADITRDELLGAVAQLNRDFRVVYQLHALEDRSYQEIARLLGIPVPTVGTRLNRARHKLRKILERRERPVIRKLA